MKDYKMFYVKTYDLLNIKKTLVNLASLAGFNNGFCHTCQMESGDRNFFNSYDCLGFDSRTVSHGTESFYKTDGYECLTIDEAIKFLKNISVIEVVLNSDYTAIVSETEIKVKCQSFPIGVLEELVKARNQLQR